jgi:hypothetical protein
MHHGSPDAVARMRQRAKATRARALVRAWRYRQRDHASGVWFRVRRVLAEAEQAFEISHRDAQQLLDDGMRAEPCGHELAPEKLLIFVPRERVGSLASRQPIPVRLGIAFLSARAVALLRFE